MKTEGGHGGPPLQYVPRFLYPASFRSLEGLAIHSAEQNVARPELRFSARSAGIQVPQLSQRTSLFFEGVFGCLAVVVVVVMSTAAFSELAIF